MNGFSAGRVMAVGSVNIDRILRCPVLPSPGETVLVTSVKEGFGGKGGNQAVAAATMGAATHLVAKVGGDAGGLKALANLRGASVGVDTVITEVSAPTGQALVMVDADGRSNIAVIGGANALLSAQDVTDALTVLRPLAGDVILTSGEVPLPCLEAVAGFLAPGTRWVHNATAAGILPAWPEENRPLLVVDETEARQLTGAPGARAAARILAESASGAVVTLGGDGALVAQEGLCEHITTPAVTVIDTTGAGDVFCGVLAAELAHGHPLTRAAATATAAGAFAVTALGARGALPRPNDLVRLRAH
ncbi:PfkB family carbohydrate kinase [Streptomyces sp. SID5910]|uniref:PfkB family carbohydrate kinase n=1 Tax=Streptomyces sp. SID5910 TaxID=2690312 RepID=UPI001370F3F6|nr:PfkB family carbohydrate kinase [Streptomyces sp. SID5910]MYR46404.1 ribokinase [Streptomyces sp. SID5910]